MHRLIAAACAGAVTASVSACSLTERKDPAKPGSRGPVSVQSADDACTLSSTKAPSGRLVFTIENTGSDVTEFYVYDADGSSILGEVENIGPGLTRDLVLTARPGRYVTACKPGMSGKGIRGHFTVSDSGKTLAVPGMDQADIDRATADYKRYVQEQSDELLAGTRDFVAAYRAGDDDRARSLYAATRAHWERIEPVAESFGDLDPEMDLREADLEQGQRWTGWHRLEKDLWPPSRGYRRLDDAQRTAYATDLLAHTRELDARVAGLEFGIDQIGNGSKSLLDEVASTKVTGEEEVFSHTDLWDIQANVDGAKAGFEAVEDLLRTKDAALYETIEEKFDALEEQLDTYRAGNGFTSYDKVGDPQRKKLSDAVNALAEPLSKVTGVLTR